jgi:hypothetical protein
MALPDDAIVIRGGVGSPETIAVNAQTTFDTDGFWAVSGYAAAGLNAAEIAQLVRKRLPHGQIRVSSVGVLRDGGFEVQETPDDYPHVDIFVPAEPDDAVCAQLADLFDDPIPNPALPNQADED